jgi:putative transposase
LSEPRGRKTYQEKLKPTPPQERELEHILWCGRTLYNTALAQRIAVYRQRGISVTRYQPEAELQDLRAELPEYAAIHSPGLHDVLARLDTTSQAFFRRLTSGEMPGFPRFQGKDRSHSFTYREDGNGARLENGHLVLAKMGRIAVRWSRPIEGTIKIVTSSQEADGGYCPGSHRGLFFSHRMESGRTGRFAVVLGLRG